MNATNYYNQFTLPYVRENPTFQSRTGKASYSLVCATVKGLTIKRDSTGKEIKVSTKTIQKVYERAMQGEAFKYQSNAKQGGISYTVAIEQCVVYAMAGLLIPNPAKRQYEVKSD